MYIFHDITNSESKVKRIYMTRLSSLFTILVLCAILPNPSNCLHKHVPFFIFGDSLFDPGNNNYINTSADSQANFWPYGETFFEYPTGLFSDDRLIPDFIAEYAKLPLIPPFLMPGIRQITYGANFASGGAGALVETHQGLVIDLKMQLSYFKKVERWLAQQLGYIEAKKLLLRAVYLINIGGNDYITYSTNSSVYSSYSQTKFVDMVIGNLTHVIKEVYKIGGRKFGFTSLVPLGCLPAMRVRIPDHKGDDCVEQVSAIAKLHNKVLSELLKKLERQLKGFKYSNSNVYNLFIQLMNTPTKFGFKEGKNARYGTGPYRGVFSCVQEKSTSYVRIAEIMCSLILFI